MTQGLAMGSVSRLVRLAFPGHHANDGEHAADGVRVSGTAVARERLAEMRRGSIQVSHSARAHPQAKARQSSRLEVFGAGGAKGFFVRSNCFCDVPADQRRAAADCESARDL